jgi:hypothetical protein
VLSLSDTLLGIALPAGVALALLLPARLLRARNRPAALAVGLAYLAGHVGVRGWRGWTPKESSDWIAASAAAGLAVGVLGLTRQGPGALRFGLRWALALAAAWFVAGRSLARRGDPQEVLGEMALIAAGAALAWSLLESPRNGGGGWLDALVLLVSTTCAAIAVGLSGSLLLARLTGVLAAALGAAVLATRMRFAPALLPGAAAVVVLTLLALLLAATVHARLPASSALLVALAALSLPAPSAAGSPPVGRSRMWALLRCLLAGGAAVGIAYAASPPLVV